MATQCPKCKAGNPDESKFCNECGLQLDSIDQMPAPTQTIEAPKEELTRGSTLANRYEIIEELGKGGMGRVYRVEDTKLKQEVALKLIKPEIAKDKKTIERFRNELKLARNIRHKNVCGMYDLGEEKGSHYITMEYVSGEDLKSFIRRVGQLPSGKAISIAKQICDGLMEAHRLEVIHRDLKPSNVMIDKEGNARIMDFGIARSLESKGITGAGVMIGTPEYMSPEQVEGKEVDQRSDIYSLGVILYEMVTGRVPFEGDTPFTVGVKHKSEIPRNPKEINAQVTDDLCDVILKCLEKAKDKRYQSAGEVRSELTNIETGIPTTERVIPEKRPLTSKEITVTFRLRKLFIPALVAIVLAILAIVIWQLFPQKELYLAPKIENSIAVISFENQTGDEAYDYLQRAIPNLLITNLENTKYFYVATWQRMRDLLKQMNKAEVEVIDEDLGFELCRREGIEYIVLGTYIKAGDAFATDVKVLDVESKKLIKSSSSRGRGVDSILEKQIDELSKEISRGVCVPARKIEVKQEGVVDVTTSSIEAYNYFLKGRENSVKFYYEDARLFLEKAVELDPSFAIAYLWLGWTYEDLNNVKARNEALEKAKKFSYKATERERLYIEAAYAAAIERDPEKAFQIRKQIADKYPKNKGIHHSLGLYYQGKNLFKKAIEEYNKALELDPMFGVTLNQLAYVYIETDNLEKAIEYLEKYASSSPGDANPIDSMAEVYFRMGKFDKSIEKYKEALNIKPDWGSELPIAYIYALKENYTETLNWSDQYIATAPSEGRKAYGHAFKGIYHCLLGMFANSLSDMEKALAITESIGNEPLKSTLNWFMGWLQYEAGNLKKSREYFNKSFDYAIEHNLGDIGTYKAARNFCLGFADLKAGKIDLARTQLEEMKSLLPKVSSGNKQNLTSRYYHLSGELLLSEGSIEKAIEVCEKKTPLEKPTMFPFQLARYTLPFLNDVLARAYEKNGEMDKSIAEYERLIIYSPERKNRHLIHPLYHYKLARLYEQKGWKGKAIEHYEKILDLWKDADSGIAEIDDAREKLARLKSGNP